MLNVVQVEVKVNRESSEHFFVLRYINIPLALGPRLPPTAAKKKKALVKPGAQSALA